MKTFSHNSAIMSDYRMVALDNDMGVTGTGIYWRLMESLAQQKECRLPISILPALAVKYKVSEESIQKVIAGYGLFVVDALSDGEFYSEELKPKKKDPESRKACAKPTVEEVSQYCRERGNGIDPNRWWDYYEARGWKLSSGVPVSNWKAAVRTWENINRSNYKKNHGQANNSRSGSYEWI